MDAYEAWRKSRVLKGGKRLKSGITIPIDEPSPEGDPTDQEYDSDEWTTSDDESDDESTELSTNIVEPSLPVHTVTNAMRHSYFSTSKTYPSRTKMTPYHCAQMKIILILHFNTMVLLLKFVMRHDLLN